MTTPRPEPSEVAVTDARRFLRAQGDTLVRQALAFAQAFPAGPPPCLSRSRSSLTSLRA